MVHLVYCDDKSMELSKIISGEKTMIIRGAAGRKIPHSRVFKEEVLYFMEKGTKRISAQAIVKNVYNYIKLTDEEINQIIKENNSKLLLTEKQKERWHKKCLCLIEFEHIKEIDPLEFDHQNNMDDWLIINNITDVVVGTSIPYNYEKSKFQRKDKNMEKTKVYFTKKINSESLVKMFDLLNRDLKGNVAVKISTGEPGGHNFLDAKLIAPLVSKLKGTIVECNTAYNGKRFSSADHWKAIEEHGFKAIAPCDIMDEFGELELPIKNGKRIQVNYVGEHLKNYNSMLMLSHFKGHAMGGFGGALKNMSIGIASSHGKAYIHGVGVPENIWTANHDQFLESMADACKGVIDYLGKDNFAYINIANNLSVDCDCDSDPDEPEMKDLGIFASLDPVALDHACYDAVKNANDPGKAALIERMDSRNAIHIVEAAYELGLGNLEYELIEIDK